MTERIDQAAALIRVTQQNERARVVRALARCISEAETNLTLSGPDREARQYWLGRLTAFHETERYLTAQQPNGEEEAK